MINLFEVKNYLFNALDINSQSDSPSDSYKIRKEITNKIWAANRGEFGEDSFRIATLASILTDILDFVPLSSMTLPGEFIEDSYQVYRDLVYSRGTSRGDIELSAAKFTEIYYGELGLCRLGLRLAGNWTNSCTLLEKAIRGLTLCGWNIEKYDTTKKRLIMKKEEEID